MRGLDSSKRVKERSSRNLLRLENEGRAKGSTKRKKSQKEGLKRHLSETGKCRQNEGNKKAEQHVELPPKVSQHKKETSGPRCRRQSSTQGPKRSGVKRSKTGFYKGGKKGVREEAKGKTKKRGEFWTTQGGEV